MQGPCPFCANELGGMFLEHVIAKWFGGWVGSWVVLCWADVLCWWMVEKVSNLVKVCIHCRMGMFCHANVPGPCPRFTAWTPILSSKLVLFSPIVLPCSFPSWEVYHIRVLCAGPSSICHTHLYHWFDRVHSVRGDFLRCFCFCFCSHSVF